MMNSICIKDMFDVASIMHSFLPMVKHGISYMTEWKLNRNKKASNVTMTSVGKQGQRKSKTNPKVKNHEGLGMETDQPEQLDAFLNQFTEALNKNQEAEETDA